MSLLHRVLSVVTTRECYTVGHHLRGWEHGLALREVLSHPADPCAYCTWRPEASVMVSLTKEEDGGTVVFVHALDRSYHASPGAMLPRGVPEGVTVLGQYVEDVDDGGTTLPRILVFDVLRATGADVPRSPRGRYELLRGMLRQEETEGGMLCVQWVGEYSSVGGIVSGAMPLPHRVEAVLLLREGSEEPCMDVLPVLTARASQASSR